MSERGRIKSIDHEKGTGIISPDVVAKVSEIPMIVFSGVKDATLKKGDYVSFNVIEGPKGLQAKNVVKIS